MYHLIELRSLVQTLLGADYVQNVGRTSTHVPDGQYLHEWPYYVRSGNGPNEIYTVGRRVNVHHLF